jgi:hypothetical protein
MASSVLFNGPGELDFSGSHQFFFIDSAVTVMIVARRSSNDAGRDIVDFPDQSMILFPKAVYPVLNLDAVDGWEALISLTDDFLDMRGLNRLVRIMDGRCAAVVVEREYIDKDYRDTFANFHAKRFSTPPSRCVRLHFFRDPIRQEQLQEGSCFCDGNDYLGYSVIRATRPNSIGRTFLSHTLRLNPDSHLCLCEERVQVRGERLFVKGFPFISQDADATVCAESSLWMILRYLSNRYPNYAETLPFQITQLASNHAVGSRVFPSSGLFSWQLAEALRLRNVSPLVYARQRYPDTFEHLLYTYVESGFPILTTVKGHVFVSYGHGSNFSQCPVAPQGTFRYTSCFNESLTICDDNHFPYQTLWKDHALASPHCSPYQFADIQEFIVPLPEKVFLSAEQAQVAIERVLRDPATGLSQLSPSLDGEDLTLRLFLTTGRALKSKLTERGMGDVEVAALYRQLPLPHFIWVCEISVTPEYQNDYKIRGEVIWDATRNAHEPNGWVALHYPEILILDVGSTFNKRQKLLKIPLSKSVPYRLFQSNLNPLKP